MGILKNTVRHFITITRHRHKVIYHCAKAGILWQGLFHDLSKYSPTEFVEGMKFYQGTRSPNERAREVYGYSKAWIHHKGRNKHHFEYWTDYSNPGIVLGSFAYPSVVAGNRPQRRFLRRAE